MSQKSYSFASPLGQICLEERAGYLHSLFFSSAAFPSFALASSEHILQAAKELEAYFAGSRQPFSLSYLDPERGSPFQKRAWEGLDSIAYGEHISYGALAAQIGLPKHSRALAQAAGKNPWLILRPCHRLWAKDGLGGFSAGLDCKLALIGFEAQHKSES